MIPLLFRISAAWIAERLVNLTQDCAHMWKVTATSSLQSIQIWWVNIFFILCIDIAVPVLFVKFRERERVPLQISFVIETTWARAAASAWDGRPPPAVAGTGSWSALHAGASPSQPGRGYPRGILCGKQCSSCYHRYSCRSAQPGPGLVRVPGREFCDWLIGELHFVERGCRSLVEIIEGTVTTVPA